MNSLTPLGTNVVTLATPSEPMGLLVVDDFLLRPDEVRESCVKMEHRDVKGPDGELYKRIGIRQDGEFQKEISQAMGFPVLQRYCISRLNYAGELPNNLIHSDDGYDHFAAVLYLNPPKDCRGGTAFWKHRSTGWAFLPTEGQVREAGQSPDEVLRELTASWNDPSAWEQVGMAEMKFNRAIFYSTHRFHSRFPFEAFGSTPEDGRLVWCSFFSHQ